MNNYPHSQPKIARVAPRSQSAYARQIQQAPNLAVQRDLLADAKRRIADRKKLTDQLTQEQIRIKAESTEDRQWPLHQVDLIAKPTQGFSKKSTVKTEEGVKIPVGEDGKVNTSSLAARIKADLQAKKEALNKRIRAAGGTRFSNIPVEVDQDELKPQRFDALGNPLDMMGNIIKGKVSKELKINHRQDNRERFREKFNKAAAQVPLSAEELLKKKKEKIEDQKDKESGALTADILRQSDATIKQTSQFFDPRFKEKKKRERKASRSMVFHRKRLNIMCKPRKAIG